MKIPISSLNSFLCIALALFCFQSVSKGVITLNDQAANNLSTDATWTMLKWVDVTGFRRAWDSADAFRDPGVNDTFRINVPLGMTGVVEVTDIGFDSDRYSLLDVIDGPVGLTSLPINQVLTDGLANGFLPSEIVMENSPSVTFANTANGGSSIWSTGTFLFTPGTHDLTLDWTDTAFDQASAGGVGMRFRTIPEPSSGLLLLVASGLIAIRRRRRQ